MLNKIKNKVYNGHGLFRPINYNPLNLPPYTIRVRLSNNIGEYNWPARVTSHEWYDEENCIMDITIPNESWTETLYKLGDDLLEIIGANTTGVTKMRSLCVGCHNLSAVALFDTSDVTNMYMMFEGCKSLSSIPEFDTRNVTTMYNMFLSCSALTAIPKFNTTNVKDMGNFVFGCNSISSLPTLDTSNVSSMSWMMYNCTALTSVPLFNTQSVVDVNRMLFNCYNVKQGALDLYTQMSTQTNPPSSHLSTFYGCGRDSETGSAEVAQIPSDWK